MQFDKSLAGLLQLIAKVFWNHEGSETFRSLNGLISSDIPACVEKVLDRK